MCTCTRVVRTHTHTNTLEAHYHAPPPGQFRVVGRMVRVAGTRALRGRSDARTRWQARSGRREAEGGSVCPEPTLNRRSMGHTLEENGKWGSWRGWPGKDGIPPYALTLPLPLFLFLPSRLPPLSLSQARSLSCLSLPAYTMLSCCLIRPLPPADPAAHPPPSFPSYHRYLISFSHPPLAMGESPHPTEPSEGARLPASSRLLAPDPARSPSSTRQ